ncbi:unnamed protein product [Linum trigynum]|uniref:Uncharacterized protein n=1 Tax=Linum trigynum TaxID=586398 RepID=A0AAV2FGC9_9ROSI
MVLSEKVKEAEITADSRLLTRRTSLSYAGGQFLEKYFTDRNIPRLEMKTPIDAEFGGLINWVGKGELTGELGALGGCDGILRWTLPAGLFPENYAPVLEIVFASEPTLLRNIIDHLEANPEAVEESEEGRIIMGSVRMYGLAPLGELNLVAKILRGIEPAGDWIPLVNLPTSWLTMIDQQRAWYGEATFEAARMSSRRSSLIQRSQLREHDYAGFVDLVQGELAGLGVTPCQVTLYGRRGAATFVPLTVNGAIYGHWLNLPMYWHVAREDVAVIGYHTDDVDF